MYTAAAVRKVFFRILTTVLFSAPPLVAAHPSPPTARQQINEQVVHLAGEAIAGLAQRASWHDYRYTLNVLIPGSVAALPACSQPLRLSGEPLQQKNLARQRYRVACGSGASWQVLVTVKADLYLPVAMVAREIARGEAITADKLVMKRYNISNLSGDPLLSVGDAAGRLAKRTLRPGKPLLRKQLQQPLLVKRGATVTIVSQTDGISAQTAGVALKEGRLQESIKVQNSSSERVIDAIVVGPGRVSVGGGTQ